MPNPQRPYWAFILLVFGMACAPEKTRLVVLVDSDMAVPDVMTTVRVTVGSVSGTSAATTERFELGTNTVSLPFTFGVAPVDDNPSIAVRLEFQAYDAKNQILFTREVITGFKAGESLKLPVFLAARCIEEAKICGAGQTCTELGCASPQVSVDDLEPFDEATQLEYDWPMAEVPDAGTVIDARVAEDAQPTFEDAATTSTDAGVIDADVIDGGVIDGGLINNDADMRADTGITLDAGTSQDSGLSQDGGTPTSTVCSSLSFDGVDDYVRIPDSMALRLSTGDFTIEAWGLLNSIGSTSSGLIYKRSSGSTAGWGVNITGTQSMYGPQRADYAVSGGQDPRLTSLSSVSTGNWNHYAFVYSQGTLSMFINGTLDTSGMLPSPNASITNALLIGRDTRRSQYHWDGHIDEVRISSVARYTGNFTPATHFAPDSDTILLLNFNEGIGAAVNDASGNGHHGSIIGATWKKTCPANPSGLDWVDSVPAQLKFTRSEVTVEQFEQCVNSGSCDAANFLVSTSTLVAGCNYGDSSLGAHPMNCVNWYGASEYCAWTLGRLPTEDEWYAEASDNGRRIYPWGNTPQASCSHVIMDDNNAGGPGCGMNTTAPVCSKPLGNSVSGLCDLSGNAWEWSSSLSGSLQVRRGGSWTRASQAGLNATASSAGPASSLLNAVGFRCVQSPLGESVNPGASCQAIKTQRPLATDGYYYIDPDGPGGNAAFEAYCDMTTDGGGWTLIFEPNQTNYNSTSLDYTLSNSDLLNRSTQALISFRNGARAVISPWASFPLPSAWKTQAPFQTPAAVEQLDVRMNGAAAVQRTLYYGYENWIGNSCAMSFDTNNPFGRICIENTQAPFYSAFGNSRADTCSLSDQPYSTTGCGTERRFSIGVRDRLVILGSSPTNPGASCQAIKASRPAALDSTYWIDPDGAGGHAAFQVYCEMTTNGGGWTLFGDIDSANANFAGSVRVGTFDQGTIGSAGYSLDVDVLHTSAQSFDVMIQYGASSVHTFVRSGYSNSAVGTLLQVDVDSPHGRLGDDSSSTYWLPYCARSGACGAQEFDYLNFSRDDNWPAADTDVPCGFYNLGDWKNCPAGDNSRRMRYYIRF